HGHDRSPNGGVIGTRRFGGARPPAGRRGPALRRLRHLDAAARRRGCRVRRRRRGRLPRSPGGRGRAGSAARVRQDTAERAPLAVFALAVLQTHTLAAALATLVPLDQEKRPLTPRQLVAEHATQRSSHSAGPTLTSILPMLSPRSSPRNASGAFS